MAPVVDAFAFGLVGILLALGARVSERVGTFQVISFVMVFLAVLGPLMWIPRFHVYAAFVLAAGVATQAARVLTRHDEFLSFVVHRTIVPLIILIVIAGGAVHGRSVFKEYLSAKNLPPAAQNSPNVLVIVLDTVRAANLSLYGYDRPTSPRLNEFAKTGVVFDHAISTSPWTLPSHASLFTGRYPYEVSANWESPLDAAHLTLAEVFKARGYATAGFVANFIYGTYEWGLNRGFTHYEDYPISWTMLAKSSWLIRSGAERILGPMGYPQGLVRKTAAEVTQDFLDWLDAKGDRPFFAFLNYMDAHAPYYAESGFRKRFGATRRPARGSLWEKWSAEEIPLLVNAYDAAIAYVDDRVGHLIDALRQRKLRANTLVIVTSDHGEHLGEHGLLDHGNSLYRPVLQIPLIVSFPERVPAGVRIVQPVTLRDIPATVIDLLGIDGVEFPGASLSRHWVSGGVRHEVDSPVLSEVSAGINTPSWFPISRGDMKSLISNGFHYIRNGDGKEELYRFDQDPSEMNDLSGLPEGREPLMTFRRLLADRDLSPESRKHDRSTIVFERAAPVPQSQ